MTRDEDRTQSPRSGIDGFDDDLARTESLQFRGRSLPYVRAITYLRGIVAGSERVETVVNALERVWDRRVFYIYFSRPFLILAALRAEAMASPDHPLARGFATHDPDVLAVTREAIVESLSPDRTGLWVALATRVPQTNEISRAVVWQWPAELAGWSRRTRPLGLVDVAASGGLNLIADQVPGSWEDATGAPLRVASDLDVRLRVGFDIEPLDFKLDADTAWARACIWPGASKRAERFDRAVEQWRRSDGLGARPVVLPLNAALVPSRLPELFAQLPSRGVLAIYQTASREYMDPSKRRRYEEGLRQWLGRAPPRRAVWLEAEATPEHPGSLGIAAHVPDGFGGVRSIDLGRTNIHPATVHVHAQGAKEFAEYFSGALP